MAETAADILVESLRAGRDHLRLPGDGIHGIVEALHDAFAQR